MDIAGEPAMDIDRGSRVRKTTGREAGAVGAGAEAPRCHRLPGVADHGNR